MRFQATDRKHFRLGGRSITAGGAQYLDYSGTFLEFTAVISEASVHIKSFDFADVPELSAWMAVFTEKDCDRPEGLGYKDTPDRRFCLKGDSEGDYLLWKSEKPERVTIRLMTLSEAAFAKKGVMYFDLDTEENDPSTWPVPTKEEEKKILFIGDSITCGYGNEGVVGVDPFRTSQENPVLAYAMTTARELGAAYNLVSWSGIGVISGWIDPPLDEPNDSWLMPEVSRYTDAGLAESLGIEKEVWDASRFDPNVIVVNLGTNDQSYTKNIPEREERFLDAYEAFLIRLREKYPKAVIAATFGIMGDELFPRVEAAVKRRNAAGDRNTVAFHFDVQKEEDGMGADFHPSMITHRKAADALIRFLKAYL